MRQILLKILYFSAWNPRYALPGQAVAWWTGYTRTSASGRQK
jgi:hypothetical protein